MQWNGLDITAWIYEINPESTLIRKKHKDKEQAKKRDGKK
jgi:hypothetical protein